jgi:hypothetical protein
MCGGYRRRPWNWFKCEQVLDANLNSAASPASTPAGKQISGSRIEDDCLVQICSSWFHGDGSWSLRRANPVPNGARCGICYAANGLHSVRKQVTLSNSTNRGVVEERTFTRRQSNLRTRFASSRQTSGTQGWAWLPRRACGAVTSRIIARRSVRRNLTANRCF